VWVRADELGFVCEFEIYTGKKDNNVSYGLGEKVVIDLTKSIISGFYHVYFDNFFTSVDLLVTLKLHNILCMWYGSQKSYKFTKN